MIVPFRITRMSAAVVAHIGHTYPRSGGHPHAQYLAVLTIAGKKLIIDTDDKYSLHWTPFFFLSVFPPCPEGF